MATGYNNADMAFTLPESNNLGISQMLYQRSEKRRLEEQQAAAKAQARQDSLIQMVGKEFDAKDYASGTAGDPYMVEELSGIKTKYATMIEKNPGISYGEVFTAMQKDVANLTAKSGALKAANTIVNDLTKEFDAAKGVDGAAIRKMVMNSVVFTKDPKTGAKRPRTGEELANLNLMEEVDKVMKNNPEIYLDEGVAFNESMKEFGKYQVGPETEFENNGVRKKFGYDAELFEFQEIKTDKSGNPTVALKSKPAVIDGQPLTINGKPMEIMDETFYKRWVSNDRNNAILRKDLNAFNAKNQKEGKPVIADGTPEADILKNHFLTERLKTQNAPKFKPTSSVTESALKEKLDFGFDPNSRRAMSDLAKAINQQNKLAGTDVGTIFRGAYMDKSVTDATELQTVNGKGMMNLTGAVGGFKLGFKKEGEKTVPVVGNIFIDPRNEGAITVKDQDGKTVTYKGQGEITKFLKRNAGYNGYSVDKVDEVAKSLFDASGKFKRGNPDAYKLEADIDRVEGQRKKFVATASTAINDYRNTGDEQKLQPFIGQKGTVKIDGKEQEVKINSIEIDKNTFIDDVVITMELPDGTIDTKVIPRPRTGDSFKKFLDNFIKK